MDVGEFAEAEEVLREAIAAGERVRRPPARGQTPRSGSVLVEFYADPRPEWSHAGGADRALRHPCLRALRRRCRPRQGLASARRRPRDRASLRRRRRRRLRGRPSTPAPPATSARSGATRVVRRRRGLRPDARAVGDRGVLADRGRRDRRPPHRGARARSARAPGGDAGRLRTARATLSAQARTTLEELGNSMLAASTSLEAGAVELLAGNPAEAERLIRRDVAELERMGAPTCSARRPRSSPRPWRRRGATPRPPSSSRRACG